MKTTDAAVYAMATYRGTKLVIDDEITRDLRDAAFHTLDTFRTANPNLSHLADKVEYFLGCPWCASIWVAGALMILRRVHPELADLVAQILALSAVSSLISVNEHRIGVE